MSDREHTWTAPHDDGSHFCAKCHVRSSNEEAERPCRGGDIPQPRYAIGHRVWAASYVRERASKECPDCLGTGQWEVETPAGERWKGPCGTCADRGPGTIHDGTWRGTTRQLTIGSMRLDTYEDRGPVSYMCLETGVGSGTVYYEQDLYESREEALARGEELAREQAERIEAENEERRVKERRRKRRKPWYPRRLEKAAERLLKASPGEAFGKALRNLELTLKDKT